MMSIFPLSLQEEEEDLVESDEDEAENKPNGATTSHNREWRKTSENLFSFL